MHHLHTWFDCITLDLLLAIEVPAYASVPLINGVSVNLQKAYDVFKTGMKY